MNIDFSGTSNVTWKWNATTNTFQRFYNGTTPDMLADGVQNQTPNVVVQYVQISYGPWARELARAASRSRPTSTPTPAAPPMIFRNGMAIPGDLAPRRRSGRPRSSSNAFGVAIPCNPATTWVELVPNTILATTTP